VPAAAQAPPIIPPTLVPPGSPIPRILPPAPPAVSPAAPPKAPAAPSALPTTPARVTQVSVEGVTAYKPGEIQALAQGLVGPAVPIAKIEAARSAILQKYRGDGYVLSTVSASLDANGVLRFVVTEGHISSVKLANDIGPAGVQVLRFLQRLTEQTPIDEATLERYLLLAQDVPGVTLHAVLQPSTDEPGALTLIAQVSRQAVSGLFTTDNYASTYTGPIESLGVVNFNSFTQFGEQTQLQLYYAWPNEQVFGQASEEVFIGSSGLKVRVYGGTGPTTPSGVLAAEGYFGYTNVGGVVLTYPVIRARTQTLNLIASFDALQSDISILSGTVRQQASYDSLRVARIGASYARSDLWLGAERQAINTATFRLSQGLPILGASPNGVGNAPRPGERTDFTAMSFMLTRTQTLFAPWHDSTVAFMGLVTGQYSSEILPPEEEFYLGGLQFTRGYYAGEVVGDSALAATAELQLNTQFSLPNLSEPIPTQFYAFYDWGESWQNDKSGLNEVIPSVGVGVNVTATRYAEVDLLGVRRLNRFPTGSGPNISPLGKNAVFWRLLARF
jgi:hemolysin activation/secretion protein